MTGAVLIGDCLVNVAVLAWAPQLFLILAALAVANRWGDGRHIAVAALFGFQACINTIPALYEMPPSIPLNLAMDAAPFVWLVTREDFGARIFSLFLCAGAVLHFGQWVTPGDEFGFWCRWLLLDYAQVLGLMGWVAAGRVISAARGGASSG